MIAKSWIYLLKMEFIRCSGRKTFLFGRGRISFRQISNTSILFFRSVFSSILSSSFIRMRCVRAIWFFSFLNARQILASRVTFQLHERKKKCSTPRSCRRSRSCEKMHVIFDSVGFRCYNLEMRFILREKPKTEIEINRSRTQLFRIYGSYCFRYVSDPFQIFSWCVNNVLRHVPIVRAQVSAKRKAVLYPLRLLSICVASNFNPKLQNHSKAHYWCWWVENNKKILFDPNLSFSASFLQIICIINWQKDETNSLSIKSTILL